MKAIRKTAVTTLLLAMGSVWTHDADAVGTRRFVLDSMSSLDGGELEGVALASDGTVRAGWTLSDVPIPDASSVWSSLVLDDGTVLLGTGHGGRIYEVKNGKVELAAETGTMAVSALARASNGDVVAGTFPEGQIFRVAPDDLDGEELENPWVELEDTEDVWAMAVDDKSGAIFAATGPEGKLFRITDGGNAEVYFDSEDPHLVSVAMGPDGSVYTGSNGKALLFQLSAPGRAKVIHDFGGDDVKDIAVADDGTLWAIANDYRGSASGLRPPRRSGGKPVKVRPSPVKTAKPGRGELMRFDPRGVAEKMMKHGNTHYVSVDLDDQGRAIVGAGHDGKVYTVSDNHIVRLLVDTEERSIGAVQVTGDTRFVATSDPVVFHAIEGSGGPDAVWTSQVLDAGLRAHWGRLDFRAEGALQLETRSGNTEEPDSSWSAWSRPLSAPGKVDSPEARFLQIRANWSKDPEAVLHEVKVAFVTDNARAVITEIEAGNGDTETGGDNVPASGTEPDDPDEKVKIAWKVDNPDNDELRYRLYYRRVGDDAWFALTEPHEEHTQSRYSWDTSGVPEGHYLVKVEASDELSNPPGRVTRHSLISQPVIVDNTAPAFTNLTLTGDELAGSATDQVGPIAHLEFSLVGKKTWWPIYPSDDVFDEATESFEVDVSNLVPQGPHLVVVRAYDRAGNRIEQTVSRGQR